MSNLSREIAKKAGCNVVDRSLSTIESHRKDLTKRLAKQEKGLEKTIAKGWSGRELIEQSIVDIKKTLNVINNY